MGDIEFSRDELLSKLKERVLEVTFIKLNGDRRVMTCTLLPEFLPAAKSDDPLSQKRIREINPEVVSVWDLNANGWRSFRYELVENVIETVWNPQ